MISNRKMGRQGSDSKMSDVDPSEVEMEALVYDEKEKKISSTPTGPFPPLWISTLNQLVDLEAAGRLLFS
eukprot:2954587-Rhodomonas_salina.1